MKPYAVLIHVPDWEKGFLWYHKAFPTAKVVDLPEFKFKALQLDDFLIEIVSSDEKVASGKAGTVIYWAVNNITEEINRFVQLGAKLYRGPMKIENGLRMCQLIDPFGNLIGLRGPF